MLLLLAAAAAACCSCCCLLLAAAAAACCLLPRAPVGRERIQSKGRTRKRGSVYFELVERGTQEERLARKSGEGGGWGGGAVGGGVFSGHSPPSHNHTNTPMHLPARSCRGGAHALCAEAPQRHSHRRRRFAPAGHGGLVVVVWRLGGHGVAVRQGEASTR